ncbi:hypothetical protein SLS55_002904 [Diplodia seriata]|uniref:Uncharacterized protein n=1 Tax=Diplodia seriata TaxID=420778 RepID=A0ABR3CPS1_9PEZI
MKSFLFPIVITTLLFLLHKPISIHAAETYMPPGSSSGPVKSHVASLYNKTRSEILYLLPRKINYNLLDRIYYLHVDMIEELDPKKQTLIWIFSNMYFVFLSVYFALLAALVTWEGFSKLVVVKINKTRTFIVAATILYFCVACSIDLWKMAEAILALVVLALYVFTLYGPYRLLGITPMEVRVRQHALVFEDLIRRYGLHMVVRILGSMDTRAESILLAELSDVNRIPSRPWHLYVVEWEETVAYRLGLLAAREYDSAHPIMLNDPWTRDDNKLLPLKKLEEDYSGHR